MANITGVGEGTLPEDVAIGAAELLEPTQLQLVCFYIMHIEEIIAFLGEQPDVPPVGEEDPDEEDPDEEDQPLITSTSYVVNEDVGAITMSFVRVNPRPGRSVQFAITALPGTALLNQQYLAPASPLIFLEGETLIQAAITILNAHLGTGVSKSLKVRISPPPSRQAYTRGPIHQADITINGVV